MPVVFSRSDSTVNAVWRLLVRLAVIAGICYACYRLKSIIITLFIAAIVAYILDPGVEWLSRSRWFINMHLGLIGIFSGVKNLIVRTITRREAPPAGRAHIPHHAVRTYATLYIFIIAILVLWQGTVILSKPFVTEIRHMTSKEGQTELKERAQKVQDQYNERAPEWARSEKIQEQLVHSDLPKAAQTLAGEVGKRILENAKYVVEVVLLPVLAFYFLIDGRKLKHEFASLVPKRARKDTLRIVREFNHIMRAFIAGQVIVCALAGVVVGIGLAALKVDYALLLGVLAGLTRAIPVIGPIIGGVPIIVLTLLSKGLPTALLVLGFFTLLHFAESKFVLPVLLGDRMELHPVVIIVVLIVGGELGSAIIGGTMGSLLGMFFAAPLASILRIIIRRYWLHLRNRPHPPAAPPAAQIASSTAPSALPETID